MLQPLNLVTKRGGLVHTLFLISPVSTPIGCDNEMTSLWHHWIFNINYMFIALGYSRVCEGEGAPAHGHFTHVHTACGLYDWNIHGSQCPCMSSLTLTTVGLSLHVFWMPGTFFGPHFHFCWQLALKTWANCSSNYSLGGLTLLTTPTISQLLMIRALRPASTPSDLKLPTVTEMVPYGGRVASTLVCANKVRNGPASAN